MRWSSLLCIALVSAASLGCSSSSDSTTGKRVKLDVMIAATPATKQAFTNSLGWSVKLDKMAIATGALYFYDGETIFSWRAPKRTPLQRFGDLFVAPAYAHPGHYVPGHAKGEMRTPSSADLLGDVTLLGVGDGVSGEVHSATFSFQSPAVGPAAGELGANVAVVEGTATKDAETRVFRADVAAAEILDTKSLPQVEGCPFASVDIEADGVVTVAVDGTIWFDQVDFEDEPKSTDGKPVQLPATSIARNGLVRGMKAGLAYSFAYAKK